MKCWPENFLLYNQTNISEIAMEATHSHKTSSLNSAGIIKPVWSKQHGAYVTLITGWLIGMLLSQSFSILHIVILLLLMAGFNGAELLIDSLKRRSPQSHRRLIWMGIYGILAIIMAYVTWMNSPFFQSMLPVFIGAGVLFAFLSVRRLQKTIPAELFTFMLFSAAGLIAYNPAQPPDTSFMVTLWILLSAYFCLSVFHVKYRIKEITAKPLIVYVLAAISVVLVAGSFSVASLLVSTLLIFKTIPLLVSPEAYRSLQIKHIGYLEMVMQGILVLILILAM